jgi:hypothetical protein
MIEDHEFEAAEWASRPTWEISFDLDTRIHFSQSRFRTAAIVTILSVIEHLRWIGSFGHHMPRTIYIDFYR